jgi:hypothetical protein
MDIGRRLNLGQLEELFPGQLDRPRDPPPDAKGPSGEIHVRHRAVMEDRPFLGQHLAGWDARFDRVIERSTAKWIEHDGPFSVLSNLAVILRLV